MVRITERARQGLKSLSETGDEKPIFRIIMSGYG